MKPDSKPSVGWSLKLGRILGIDVYIHFTFLLLLGFIGVSHWTAEGSLAAAASGILFFLALFGCVLLHEYGHALMARRYGIQTRDITLLPIGGLARLERMPDKPLQEFWVALAGPAVNVVIAAALAAGLTLTHSWQPVSSLTMTGGGFFERLLVVNLFLVVFNLLPAFPMDGGRVLRSLLALRLDYARATRIAAGIGQGMAALFGLAGLFGNPMLLLIALFVWIGAGQEAAAIEIKSSFAGVPVRAAMLTEFRTLSPQDRVGDATKLLLAGSQQDFPVVDGGRVVGVLTHRRLFEALRERGETAPVGQEMESEFRIADVDEPLDSVMTRLEPGCCTTLPVLRHGQLVGLLTAENVGEYFMIRSALRARGDERTPPLLPPSIRPTGRASAFHPAAADSMR
jgi:Zn-dependent protease/CBS domain-containing protein